MQQCPFCSSQIQEGLGACPYCNENLLRPQEPAPPPSKATEPASPPPSPPPADIPPAPATTGEAKRPCPHCGESIDTGATICKYCGLNTVPPSGHRPPDRRPCPFCAETILASSRLCRYCGSDVTRAPDPNAKRPCPHCKEPIAATDLTCRYCGNDARVAKASGPRHIDWEDTKRNVFARWWTTWAGSQFGADRFWSVAPFEGGYGPPTKFVMFMTVQYLILAAACFVPFGILMLLGVTADSRASANVAQGVGIALLVIVVGVPLVIGLSVVLAYMVAGLTHLFVMLLGGKRDLEATYRVTSYALGTYVWQMIPYAGVLVHLVFHLLACTHGLAHAHGLSKGRAFAAAFLPVVTFCGLLAAGIGGLIALG